MKGCLADIVQHNRHLTTNACHQMLIIVIREFLKVSTLHSDICLNLQGNLGRLTLTRVKSCTANTTMSLHHGRIWDLCSSTFLTSHT